MAFALIGKSTNCLDKQGCISYYILQFEKTECCGEDCGPSQRATSRSELSPELIADVLSISIASMRVDLPCIGGCDEVNCGIVEYWLP
jgi:hypothetical protein